MTHIQDHRISRRDFLRLSGTGLAAAGLGSLVGACGGGSQQELEMWWWGQQEAKGLKGWLEQSISMYRKKNGVNVTTNLQDTGDVIPGFQRASAANRAPDIQFFWNGIYHMESVWQGYVEPLNGLVPAELRKSSNATVLSVYNGKQYRLGWYAVPLMWMYNKEMFDKAGLNADAPPKTWDSMLDACDSLKSKGITPITGGLKDGYWGEWWMGHGLGQNLDAPADAARLFTGDLSWTEPRYYDHWSRLEQMWKSNYINENMNSIDLYPGIDLFNTEKGAMTQVVGPLVPQTLSTLGTEKVGLMVFPVFGEGKMAGRPIADAQGLGISSQSANKEGAAKFLEFLHTDERVQALWKQVHQLPADSTWDGSVVSDPVIKEIWQRWMHGDNVAYISNLMPTLFWNDAMFVNSQKIVSGDFTGEQAGEKAESIAEKWRKENPDFVKRYNKWINDLTL